MSSTAILAQAQSLSPERSSSSSLQATMVNNGCRGCGVEERRRGDHCQDQGNRTTPSYVTFTDTELLIGDTAKSQVARNTNLRASGYSAFASQSSTAATMAGSALYWIGICRCGRQHACKTPSCKLLTLASMVSAASVERWQEHHHWPIDLRTWWLARAEIQMLKVEADVVKASLPIGLQTLTFGKYFTKTFFR